MTSREQFEKFIMSVAGNVSMQTFMVHDSIYYKDAHIQGMWRAWQASRAAIEIELPERHYFCDNDGSFFAAEEIIYEIEQAGLKVKK